MNFGVTSRYYGLETAKWSAGDHDLIYLRRRFLPPASASVVMVEHPVVEGDRLDNITARYLGDPEQFWRVCDANNAMHPREMTEEVGRRLHIPLPQ
ncbi:MAG TPA: LysM domain-containing protein [Thermoanaerobaculia bacterium]|jgi:hypothetical protein|nr:LysM domain-containing protein [Thermoanaerobaculia bacterium]